MTMTPIMGPVAVLDVPTSDKRRLTLYGFTPPERPLPLMRLNDDEELEVIGIIDNVVNENGVLWAYGKAKDFTKRCHVGIDVSGVALNASDGGIYFARWSMVGITCHASLNAVELWGEHVVYLEPS